MPWPAPPVGKLQKDYDKLPVPQPQATSVRKREPKLLAVIDPGKCFGRGCEYCVAVCPVPDCITYAPDPAAPMLHVLSVNLDTCIGCMACEKWCPDDYDAIRMLPFSLVMKDRDAYETATFSAVLPDKKQELAAAERSVLYCSPNFPRARLLLAERLQGSGLRLAAFDAARPLESQVADVVALVPSVARITASVIAAATHLKAIVQFGAGLDNVDRDAAAARGIAVRNVPGANAQAVAELALFLMLALARRLPLHRRSFAGRVVGDPPGTELAGKTLGIVGLGASGRKLARMARGIGMEVIALRRDPAPDSDASWVGGPADLHALLGRADYVSLHLPTTAETRGLINGAAFRAMKPTASLVNVGRGDLVDRAALLDALDSKTIAGAGLDVYWAEPPDPGDPLLGRDDVVATPHVGGVTEEALDRIATRVAEILKELVGPRPA